MAKATDAERIARLHVPAEEDVPAEVKELWALPLEKLGFVPNVLRVFALRPKHLLGWWTYYDELLRGESGLTKAQREMIAVVVSVANRCHYCIVSHTAALRKLTKDPDFVDQLATGYKYAELEPRDRAMLDFAVKLTEASDRCSDEDVVALRDAGWSDEEIMDIAQVAAMFNFTNRLASGLGWVPNREYFSLGR
ncbi:MAG TPA: peroxidase-related enzyme [Gaiellaceae bacterium]|nr:peroxidase-related enzyme [Gaiellaceae bacterium]